jgi:hypothetical protein
VYNLYPALTTARPVTDGKFSTMAVDKTVEKAVRIATNRCHAWAATRRL